MTDVIADIEARVRDFIQDYYDWGCFVAAHYDRNREEAIRAEMAARYRALITKYCGSEKVHQGLALSSHVDHTPIEQHITKTEVNADRALVATEVRFETGFKKGWVNHYEFEFKRVGDAWILDELFYDDGNGRYPSL